MSLIGRVRKRFTREFAILSIGRNTIVYLAGTAIGRLAVLAMTLVLAHRLGPADLGRYGFMVAYLAFFRLLANLGLTPVLAKEFARSGDVALTQTLRIALGLKLALAALAIAAASLVIMVVSDDPLLVATTVLASFSLAGVMSELFAAYFQSRERMEIVIGGEALQLLLTGLLGIFLLLQGGGLLGVAFAMLVGNLAQLVALGLLASRDVRVGFALNIAATRRLLRDALPVAAMAAFSIVNLRVDLLLLFALRPAEQVGAYTAAVRIAEIVVLLSIAFTASIFPRLSQLHSQDGDRFMRMQELGTKYLLVIIVPIAIAGVVLAKDVMLFVYGDAYRSSAVAFAVLMAAELFLFLEIFNTYVLIASDRQRFASVFTVVGGVANIVANLALIPAFGIEGAAMASLISYASYFVIQGLWPATRLLTSSMIRQSVRPVVASLAMAVTAAVLEPSAPALAVVVAPVTYLAALAGLKGVSRDELRWLFLTASPLAR